MAQNMNIFDSDAYGVNTDSPESVLDWFNPDRETCKEAGERFDTAINEVLIDIADMCHIPYDVYREWDSYEWGEFREALGI